jgi:hypothetical protein
MKMRRYFFPLNGLIKNSCVAMFRLIRFVPVEMVSVANFVNGRELVCKSLVASMVLLPYYETGKVAATGLSFPEIFFQ